MKFSHTHLRIILRLCAILVAINGGMMPAGASGPKKPDVSKKKPAEKITPIDLKGAKWIWAGPNGENAAQNATAGTFNFRKGFTFPAGAKPVKGEVLITCDNIWVLHINGKKVGQSDSWQQPQVVDVSKNLTIEQNAIAVEATNTIPGPAGLILKLRVQFEDGKKFELISEQTWRCAKNAQAGWDGSGFVAGENWAAAKALGDYGIAPWGNVTSGGGGGSRMPVIINYPKQTSFENPVFKDGIVFVRGYIPFNAHDGNNYIQNIHGSRAYFEMDPPTPAALGRQLVSLIPFKPDGKLTVLCDAKGGMIGSPSVSYDGQTIYFSLAKKDEAYYHIYAVGINGEDLRQVTTGPFHDYDPTEMPDGRIVFSSTRIGSREEYHAKYASSLFTCDPDGKDIVPLTYHIVADREPRITAKGLLTFIRSDNFLERAKVETHLHQTRSDGTGGQVIIGPGRTGIKYEPNVGAEQNASWLRNYGVGSCTTLPDGRVVAINQAGMVTSASPTGTPFGNGFVPYDMSPLPDGRLLCTSIHRARILIFDPAGGNATEILAIADIEMPGESEANLTQGYNAGNLHSVIHLAPRTRPMMMPSMVDPKQERRLDKTGFLYCQNALNTQHKTADTKRIKAVRFYEGRPFTLEPTKTIYAHIGTVGVELGTVPLAKDGSFYVEVPADRPLAMQGIDGEGRAVLNEMSWIYVRPGEQRACVGCHAAASSAPVGMVLSDAVKSKPLKLLGQGKPHRFRANNAANGGVLNLQLDRFREIAAINLPAGSDELLKKVNDSDADERLSAIRQMGILRGREFVPALSKALREEKMTENKCAAALALSSCGNRNAVGALIAALSDRNANVKNAAQLALEHITGGTPVDSLKNPNWPAIEKTLAQRLASKEIQDVILAIEALGHVGGTAGKKAIREFLSIDLDAELRVQMAAMRSLGYLKDTDSVGLLTQILNENLIKKSGSGFHEIGFIQKPVYLATTAVEALGWIGTPEAQKVILDAFGRCNHFQDYTHRIADHTWLMGCHSSPLHYRMLEALDRNESTDAIAHLGRIIESIPADKDRGLLYELDSYESLSARVIARNGAMKDVTEACLAVLGDKKASSNRALADAVSLSPHAEGHIRKYSPQARAAQILSVVCSDLTYANRIVERLKTFRAEKPSEKRSWCCFYLIRTLGKLGDRSSTDLLVDILQNDPTEASLGLNPPPTHIIYKAWRPFHRPAAAWSLGMLKEKKAVPALLNALENLDNASSTRQQAAIALGRVGDSDCLEQLTQIGEHYPEVTTRRSILESIKRIDK
ncbi:MAG: HEAT repeat domain-containing protein [Phycisphaerae bacterium]|nr:HEAT repeat domain-containing protein [Phycisphaerae bacterium]